MTATLNIIPEIRRVLTEPAYRFMETAGRLAAAQQQKLYLVGGIVRDALLGRAAFDLDLVSDGDAITLAQGLAAELPGKLTVHRRFGTASIVNDAFRADLATLRSETYEHPGALPRVTPGTLADDLFRRDFTVNAMAVSILPPRRGELIDLHGGQPDLAAGLVRVLHPGSFGDDPTRIWRALRYEQRLGFRLEAGTERLLKRDLPQLATPSGERIRYELECICREASPEAVIRRADRLGILPSLHPELTADRQLGKHFAAARELYAPEPPPFALYLSLLAYGLDDNAASRLAARLRLAQKTTRTLRDTISVREKIAALSADANPSAVVNLLEGSDTTALKANLVAAPAAARKHISSFLKIYRYVRPALNGDDLLDLGVKPGPALKDMLGKLRHARLEGRLKTRRQEEILVRKWLSGGSGGPL